MAYVKIVNDSVDIFPYTIRMLRNENKNVSFPETISEATLNSLGVFWVLEESPALLEYQKLQASTTPVKVDGIWKLIHTAVDKTVDERKNELAELRYNKEISGTTFNAMPISTDRPSQAMLTGAYNTMQQNPDKIINWKSDNGFVQLDKTAIEALSDVVANHVQACFDREMELITALELDITTDITTGWPV